MASFITTALSPSQLEASESLPLSRYQSTSHSAQTTDYSQDGLKELALHNESRVGLRERRSSSYPASKRLSQEAHAATQAEKQITLRRGWQLYPKAMAWSFILSTTIIMEGYGVTLVNAFYGSPAFRQAYGKLYVGNSSVDKPSYQISSAWQAGLTNGASVGEILGLVLNGYLNDRFGYRFTMIASMVWIVASIFLSFFATNLQMLLAFQILSGVPWGIFETLSTTYAAEVMPIQLRSYLLSTVNMCWLIGQIISVGIIRSQLNTTTEWTYRIPFALQWALAVPILVAVSFAPESPWWLVRNGKPKEAEKALNRLIAQPNGQANVNVGEVVSMMQHTNEVEKRQNDGGMSFLDCFRGEDLRRTEIACMVWICQALCGSSLIGYAVYFFEQAGFNTTVSFNLAIIMFGMGIVGGVLSWVLMRKVGRRDLYLGGLCLCLATVIVGGVVSTLPHSRGTAWAIGSLIIFLTFVYDTTLGPVCYVLVPEIPSTRLRTKTVALARIAYNIVGILNNVITPRFLNPTTGNYGGRTCFFFAGTCALCLLWCIFRLPETRGLSYLELDILFEKKASARKFKAFRVCLEERGYFSLVSESEAAGYTSTSLW